jgi:hypothetical protein
MQMKFISFCACIALALLACAPTTTRKPMNSASKIDVPAAKSIAIKFLQTQVDAKSFLPESTSVNDRAQHDECWSVYIKKANWQNEEPPVFLISVDKKTGTPKFVPLE